MSELIKKLYDIAGSYSKNITKMLIYDVIKGLSSGISTGALFLTLIKIMEQAIYQKPIEMTDIKSVVWLGIAGLVGKIIFGYAAVFLFLFPLLWEVGQKRSCCDLCPRVFFLCFPLRVL